MRKTMMKWVVILGVLLLSAASAGAVTLTVPLTGGSGDSEERPADGVIDYLGSPDLDLGQKIVGLRFEYFQVPQGATINKAYIQFVAHPDSLLQALDLRIWGEDRDQAEPFTDDRDDLSDRRKTSAFAPWAVVNNWVSGAQVDTSDISPVVEEVVGRENWSMGNPLVLLIDGNGWRTVYSHDSSTTRSARLVVDYTPKPCSVDARISLGSDDAYDEEDAELYTDALRMADKWVGLRFTNLDIPQGATITKAYLDLATSSRGDNDKNRARVQIKGQRANNPPTFSTREDDMKDRRKTGSTVDWNNIRRWRNPGEKHRSPDISNIVQDIIGRGGWARGNAMVIFMEDREGERPLLSYDENPEAAPLLHVEWDCDITSTTGPVITVDVASAPTVYLGATSYKGFDASADSFTIANTGDEVMNFDIPDGVETWFKLSQYNGTLNPGEEITINVAYPSSALGLGVYETTVTINDANATNNPVAIPVSLTVEEIPNTNVSCDNVPLYIQNKISPAVLLSLDLSGSMGWMMTVQPPGEPPRTPDISSIVQEIVDRPNWASGNNMAFIVEASGNRRAYSYDGMNGASPQLFVTYADINGNLFSISQRTSTQRDDAEQSSNGSNFSSTSGTLDLGNRDVGMRFQNLGIPQGSKIVSASIEFAITAGDSNASSWAVFGHATDNAGDFRGGNQREVTNRTQTAAKVAWTNVPAWDAPTQQMRITIAQQVLSDIVKNRNINWGFSTWTSNFSSGIDYTKIDVGAKTNTDAHQQMLQDTINATVDGGGTPFCPSLIGARKYFTGIKQDLAGENFPFVSCQDRFVISVTDGIGNRDSTVALAETRTNELADEGISTIVVGFGIDDAVQIAKVAEVANKRGNASETDGLYALHEEDAAGVGQPFIATNKEGLLDSLMDVSRRIENRFTGSAPAPTTSADDQDLLIVLIAEFGSASWSGDLKARTFNTVTGQWDQDVWSAMDMMPANRNVWTADATGRVPYTDATLANDNFLCKDIGDIIHSAPVIVKKPNSFYEFDGYRAFYDSYKNRNQMVYIGSNDGQLHAFQLTDNIGSGDVVISSGGTEMWSFVPPSLLSKMDYAKLAPENDMCDPAYCHQYYVDGSPKAFDIYTGLDWKTILVTGLREGGTSYFAMDVTDGEPMQASGTTGAQYLWEFTDPELGQTWDEAEVMRIEDLTASGGKTWGAFFGSGYADNTILQANKEAYVFGVDAYKSYSIWGSGATLNRVKLSSTPLRNDATGGVLAVDKDKVANWAADQLYVGNLYGDMYRITGIGRGQTPVVSKLYDSDNTNHNEAIRSKADYAYTNYDDDLWIYFGTGRYETQVDKLNTDRQYFFGLRDTADSSGVFSTTYVEPPGLATAIVDKATTNTLSTAGGPDLVYLDAASYSVSVGTETKLVKVIEGKNQHNEPWVLRLDNSAGGERVTEQPLVAAGVVFFTTFIPDDDPCGGSGESYLYAVDYKTGGAPDEPVFDINEDGYFNDSDNLSMDVDGDGTPDSVPVSAIYLGKGQASRPVLEGGRIFVTTTSGEDEDDDGDPDPPEPPPVNLPGMEVKLDQWRDTSF